ncbi:Aspartate/methionine/tyrosine aminotransferase [Aliiroseovarius halocynthiae]|uniref:Aminotransferase class I/II-fold pyridoxal phosphate-dependent enzyme n=1 Tax=Aliiroseovarius halocynthiae TaxID=985055 RepID=A0A545SPG8_9RHOB|nr:aminotransferase class I/II-fold pyridoxal phosphate-dependent enzyme [Aliiroseovarius halocynthiae]TQV66875.1 aminotransferase class I/II-fold pyridoxal phosphate-dependent enzyme [Aliiroseovarius halocynthiae]SMR82285.1 Aspartate/methionine/tyrosine aminotransferase [Aliiroseovarius halocynthiae]
MTFPERYSGLPEYAFPRLRTLLDAHAPGGEVMHMTIGEPKHPFPNWVPEVLAQAVDGFAKYPPNDGAPELLDAISGWLDRRYGVDVPQNQIMALNGTREGLFNALIALCPEQTARGEKPVVLIPNPFYQVYAVAAVTVGAEPVFLPATAENHFLPDYSQLSPEILNRTEVAFICSPTNPQGAVADRDYWANLIALAEKYDFKIFADECYSEIYRDTPPPGALEVAREGGADPERVTIFHSLSKRSNLPGLRSGFVAGGPESIKRVRQLRAYAGAPLPLPLQRVAERAWTDEAHVAENRALYQEKYQIADQIFAGIPGYRAPEAGFFLWLPVEDGEEAAMKLWLDTGVRVLPGAYLSRDVNEENPGKGFIRVALVAPKEDMTRGLIQIRDCLYK